MSRTYKRDVVYLDENNKPIFIKHSTAPWRGGMDYNAPRINYYGKKNLRINKRMGYKPPKSFKKIMERSRRAKVQKVMRRRDYDNIPVFRKENIGIFWWMWC